MAAAKEVSTVTAKSSEILEVARALLDAGADVNPQTVDGETPLMFAVIFAAHSYELLTVVWVLLDAGADVDARTPDNRTALIIAAKSHRDPNVVLALLDAGVDVAIRDGSCRTAFDDAQMNSFLRETDAYQRLKNDQREN